MSIATFTLKSATTQAAAPFSLGHAFKKGDVPSGSQLVAGFSDLQVVPKNVWSDGSLKFAIISGRAALTADTPLSVVLSIGTPAGGTALTTTDLKATGVVAAIDAGAFGAVSWATTDWDTPWQSWVSGPKMSSWVYRKQVGSDAHLVAFVEVRLFSGGEVEVLPWIENGYFTTASPTNKSDTYTFTLGGTQRYTGVLDFKHHTRSPLINGASLSYWIGTDPGVTPKHDKAYLQASELVPTYSASLPAIASLVSTYAPFQAGNISYDSGDMTSPGYQRPIGLLPEHDVAYLVCTTNDELLYGSVVRNGYSAGRYPIHYREEATNRAPRFSVYPTKVLSEGSAVAHTGASSVSNYTPTPAGGASCNWDTAHCPSLGFMAYLVTGHWFHVETMQFAATLNWFNITDWLPEVGYPIRFYPAYGAVQARTAAWGLRTLAQALTVMPDDDSVLRSEFISLAEQIVDYYSMIYIEQPNNPYGLIQPGEEYPAVDGCQMIGLFQQEFLTAVFGYSISMGVPIAAPKFAKLETFFQWNAKHVVGRLGTASTFWYVNGVPYNFPGGPVGLPDYRGGTGPWMSSWSENYRVAWFSLPAYMSSTEGLLGSEFTSDGWGKSLWGNVHPSIAYAVRHGVPGAEAGYNRMISATNYDDIQATFSTSPVWSVAPASIGSTAMGKTIRCDTVSLVDGMIVCGDRGLGVLAADIPTGFERPSMLENDIDPLDPEGTEYRVEILTGPSVGTLFVDENGAATYTPPTPSYVGTATGTQRVWKNGVSQGETTYSFANAATLTGATSSQSNAAASGAVTLATALTGTGTSQDSTSSTSAITQDVVLGAAVSSQENSTSTGVNTQEHILAASPASSANESSAASLIQLGELYAGDTEQFNECTSGTLEQVHLLAAAASAQDNSSSIASLESGVQTLVGAPVSQANECSAEALEFQNGLIGSPTVENHTSLGAAVSQVQVLAGAASTQAIVSGAGSMAQVQTLEAALTAQTNASAAGTLNQSSVLVGSSTSQVNAAMTAPVSQVHVVAGSASLQSNPSTAGAVSQVHSIVVATTVQNSQSLIGALDGGIQIVAAAPASQANGCITGGVSQVHMINGAATAGQPSAAVVAVTQDQVLTGATSTSSNVSLQISGASQVHAIAGSADSQFNGAAPGYVVITFDLFDISDVQSGTSSSAPIFVTHDLGGLPSSQANQCLKSAVRGIHIMHGLNAVQVNVSPTLSLAGHVTIYKPPPNHIFKLSPAKSQRHFN